MTISDTSYPEGRQAATATEGKIRHKANAKTLAFGEHIFRRTFAQVIFVLHGDNGRHPAGLVELRNGDIRDSNVANLPRLLRIRKSADRFGKRYFRIRRMELIQVDSFDLKAAETSLNCAAQVLRTTVRDPGIAVGPQETPLGCNY